MKNIFIVNNLKKNKNRITILKNLKNDIKKEKSFLIIFIILGIIYFITIFILKLIFYENSYLEIILIGILFVIFILALRKSQSNPILKLLYYLLSIYIIFYCIYIYTIIYMNFGIINTIDNMIVNDFWSCFYFSIITFTTLGYGDLRPTEFTRMYSASEALLGYVTLGLIISYSVSYILKKK